MNRIIAHLDMDAFFAAVEERDHEWLKDKPIVVGADPKEGRGRGVVSTANYKAREYGIHSAMPISKAWQLAKEGERRGKPRVEFVHPHFPSYEKTSERIFAIIRKYSPAIEPASIDEAYLDLTEIAGSSIEAIQICRDLKKEIKEKEKLTCSIGLAKNKLLAKIASDQQKPDGLTIVVPDETEQFLDPLPMRVIPGIGPKTQILFEKEGLKLVKDLKKLSQIELKSMLGKWGMELYQKIRGEDDSPVLEEYEVKSIGEQETFEKDTLDPNFLLSHLQILSEGVWKSMQKETFRAFQTIVVTVRFKDFITVSRSKTSKIPLKTLKELHGEALKLFFPFVAGKENPKRKLLRLIGVRVEKLK